MKSFLLISLSLFIVFLSNADAQQVLFQGFEGTGFDNFAFTATPTKYNNIPAEDVWSDTTSTFQISPATGSRQWFMRDLENPSGGGAFEHTLDFGPVDVSAFSANTFTFKFFTNAYDTDDSIGYYIAYDNGTDWTNYTPLNKNALAWETVTVNAPAGTQFVRLRLAARQNGGSDYAAWDDIQLVSAQGDIVPPTVISAAVTGSNSLQIVFSEPVDASAENTANYTGVPDLASAVRNTTNDTVTLTFATPFTLGVPYTLIVDGVQDLAGNVIAAPYQFNFTFSLPLISFVTARVRVDENVGTINIPVKVDGLNVALAKAKVRVVQYSTAVENEDFVLLDTFVAFPAGTLTPFDLKVNIIDNSDQRDSRYIILQLFDFTTAQAGAVTEFVVLISDNDTPAPQAKANAPIHLRHLSSFDMDPTASATAEISVYDPISKRLFTTNISQNKLEIVDLKNPVVPAKIASIDITPYGGGINSVDFANGVAAVAVDAVPTTDPGKVVFLDMSGAFLSEVTVGALPDHVVFTNDGTKLLVANEAEPATDYSVDPEGSVSVIDMTPGASNLTQANVSEIGFTQFNTDSAALTAAGVRIFGPNTTVAQNLEPEYITISDDGNTAWVTLQEANAVAVLDLQNNTVTSIVPLGLKDYATQNVALDASDQAPGIFFNNWKVKGMYQPDAIAHWNVGGTEYLITANEGDVREWNAYTEIVRLSDASYVLDSAAFPDATYLKRAELLGRLNVTTANGDTDGDGDYDEIHSFGGRSFSIWNAATGTLLWDSGDDFERITAADPTFGPLFNASNSNNTRKNRSDDKGPEPEGIVLGAIDGRNYAFTVLERIGGVMVYDVTNPAAPEYVQWINTRAPGTVAAGDLGPEGVLFIPKAESPNQRDLLVVSNEISGTISIFEINIDRTKTGEYEVTKYAFDNNPAIGVYGDTIREGGISGLMYRDGSFRFIGDRGPNADAINSPLSGGQTTLVFPFPDYAPKVWQVRPENGALTVEDFDFVKRPDGTGASGLPLPVGQGNTGEVAWSDTLATIVPNDPWGLDSEGITQDNEGNFWICDEYGVSIWKLDQNFKVLNRYTPFPHELEDLPLDSLLGKRRANRGLEGITYTPNGKIFAIIQSPTDNPNTATGNSSRIHRLVELDPSTGSMRTFVYVHEPDLGQIRSRDWKLGDLIAINNEEFLTVEHAERNGWNSKNIYKFSIAGATPVSGNDFNGQTLEQLLNPTGLAANGIVPVQKEFFTDLLELGWERQHDKPEGLAILNDSTFAVINDNDFGIAAPNGDGKIVLTGKTTRLYVFGLPTDKHLDYVNPYCKADLGQDFVTCGPLEAFLALGGQGFTQATWSDGNTDVNRIIDSAGTYAVAAVNQYGCIARDTITLGQSDFPAVNLGENQSLCPGATVTLDAGIFQTYNWSNGATTQTISVNNSGGYAVSVTNQFGCEGVDFVFLTSAQNPTVELGPNKNLCAGQTLTLDAGNIGASYLWSNGETTQTIAANLAGAYTVNVTSPEGCVGSDAVTLVNAATPNVDLGNDITTCEGQAVTLSNGYPGAATIWSTGATSVNISVEASGTYSVQVTLVTGCSDTDTVRVTVLPTSSNLVIGNACPGEFFEYNGIQITAGASQQFTLINSVGCDSIVTVEVTANPVPTVNLGQDSTICDDQTLALDAGNSGALYSWSNGATTQTITVNTENVYAVTVANGFGCTATDDVLVEVEICVGIKESDWAAGMKIFPNPTSGFVSLNLSLANAAELRIEVLNPLGQTMQTHSLGKTNDLNHSLDLSNLAQGTYFIRVTVDGTIAVRRVMVQR
ncbi:MAG: choice-of-anchor I family protein [Phycisphaerae bacterium]|nr:choice-of-anchor I family protein [Saprospiraceae bacterium]